MEVSNQKKEAYYTATQMQLVRTRFFGNRSAMIAGSILLFMMMCSLFGDFLSPYDPTIKEEIKIMKMEHLKFQCFGMIMDFQLGRFYTH